MIVGLLLTENKQGKLFNIIINKLNYNFTIMKILLFLLVIFASCTKAPPEPQCYTCTFGTIGNQKPNDEVHCEDGDWEHYYKKNSLGQNYPTSCRKVR